MKTRLLLTAVLLLSACVPAVPEIPMNDVPAAPLVQGIGARSGAVTSLKAVARFTAERRGKKRVYESVAVLAKGRDRLRVEGYGPLGEPVFSLLWDGKDLSLRLPGEPDSVRPGPRAFERLLGFPLAPSELASVLLGSLPPSQGGAAQARCPVQGACIVEYRADDARWKAHVVPQEPFLVVSGERFRGDEAVYRVRFDDQEPSNGQLFPRRVIVESADRRALLVIEYLEADVNVPVDDSLFFSAEAGGDR